MPDAPALPALHCLNRILALRGRPTALVQLRERLGASPSPEAILGEMLRHGFHPRWAEVDAEDLAHLDLPTILMDGDGGMRVLLRRTPQGLFLEDESEAEVFLGRAASAGLAGGRALDLLPALPEGNLWTRILKMLWRHRRALAGILWVSLLTQGLALATPQFTEVLVDRAFPDGAQSIFRVILAGFVLAGAFQLWVGWLGQKLSLYLENRVSPLLQRGLLAHVLRLPYGVLRQWTAGELMQGFSGVASAKDLLTGNVLGTLLGGVTAVLYFALMVHLSVPGSLFIFATAGASATMELGVGYYQALIQRAQVKVQARERSFLVEMMGGVPTLKAFGAEREALGRWTELYRRGTFLGLHSNRVSLFSNQALSLVTQAQALVVLVWGGRMVLSGAMSLGELLAFTMYGAAFQGAVLGFASTIVKVWLAQPFLRTAQALLDQAPEAFPPPVEAGHGLAGPVRIRNLSFRYGPNQPWVLEDFNLEVEPGQSYRIQGPSGWGKTTLMRLVAGFYAPDRGEITIGGLNPVEGRHLLIYLPQFVTLFDGSILDNLRLYSCDAPRARLMEAARMTGLDELVEDLPMGYDTQLTQKGGNFSGGQRQLIALTAVVASDRPLLLLDEAMANLDNVWKARLAKSDLLKGRTVLFAAHDGADLADGDPYIK